MDDRIKRILNTRADPLILLLACVCIGYAVVLFQTAWQCDDAFIVHRTAKNFVEGHGLVWNPGERVQTYTSPAWLLVSIAAIVLFGEPYFSVIAVSVVLSLASLVVIASCARGHRLWTALVIGTLATSAGVIDYSTSGLENPLLSLLLVGFCALACRTAATRPAIVVLLASAIVLTRLDAVLIVLPALASLLWKHRRSRRAVGSMLLGLAPVVAWELFALMYYGAFLPNTAYAKLNTAIPRTELVSQGFHYVVDAIKYDPASAALICLGVAFGLGRPKGQPAAVAAGIVLYLVYIVAIGGDFMAGRFFSALCYLSAAIVLMADPPFDSRFCRDRRRSIQVVVGVLVIAYGVAFPGSRWRSGSDYGEQKDRWGSERSSGISDERAYYYPQTGLLPVLIHLEEIEKYRLPVPPYRIAIKGWQFSRTHHSHILVDEIGYFGYFAGHEKYIIDAWAIAEPFLARIPSEKEPNWRIGHFARPAPQGYFESRINGVNVIENPDLAAMYDSVNVVTTGELFSARRWKEIWKYNFGYSPNR